MELGALREGQQQARADIVALGRRFDASFNELRQLNERFIVADGVYKLGEARLATVERTVGDADGGLAKRIADLEQARDRAKYTITGAAVGAALGGGTLGAFLSGVLKKWGLFFAAIAAVSTAAVLYARASPPAGSSGQFRDWYQGLEQPGSAGASCCSLADCRHLPTRQTERGYEVLIDAKWVAIPPDTILAPHDNPTGEPVTCHSGTVIYCFVPGPLT